MAITDTKQAKDFIAGAPKITLEGDLRPNQMMAGSSRYQIILDELINEMEDALGRPITNDEYDKLGKEAYEKLYESSISTEQNQMMAMSDDANERALEQIFEQLLEEGFSLEDAAKRAREIFNERAMADGGRVNYQEGGGIEQRLEQLGGDVTSAEQMLQDINKRLETAESSLGSGGGGINTLTTIAGSNQPFIPSPNNPLLRPGSAAQPLPFMSRPLFDMRPLNATLPTTLEAVQPLAGSPIQEPTILQPSVQTPAVSQPPANFQPAPIPAGAMVGGTITADNTLDEIMASIDESRKVGITPLFGNNAGDGLFSLNDPNAPRFDNLRDAFKFAQRNAEVLRGGKDRLPGDRAFAGERGFDDFSKNYFLQDGALTRNPTQSPLRQAMGMADGGRAQYGLGSFVKSIGKAVKGVAKGVKKVAKSPIGKAAMLYFAPMALGQPAGLAGYQSLFSRVGPGITSLKDRFFPQFVDAPSDVFRKKSMLSSFLSPKSDAGKFARNFVIGSLATGALAAAEAGGLDTSDPNAEIDVEALKSYLRTGYQNLNPGAQPEEVEEFVTANVAEYNSGGRVGLQFGGGFDASQEDFGKEDLGPGFNGGDNTPFFNRPQNLAPVEGQLRGAFETGIANLATNKIAKELGLGAAVKSVPQIMAVMGLLQALKGRDTFAMGSDKKVEMASGIEGLPININSKGVKELDLRETGGFIPPVGVKEKADDIPAMLSNNEFVFTADAVRAAGGGDVNKGAEIMYDTMKNLESRVA